jgi:hypothetical protein
MTPVDRPQEDVNFWHSYAGLVDGYDLKQF